MINVTRFRRYLISSTANLKRKTIVLLDQVFPEYKKCFSDVFEKTSKEILLSFTTPQGFENISSSKLSKALKNITMKKFAKKKIEELSEKAKTTTGVKFCLDSFSLQIKMLIEQISFIENQVESIEEAISTIMAKLDSPITAIPGIGPVIGATILGELGDISRFSNVSKIVAYAGLDSVVS
ncbi:Transposase IS116/IS110/IS902 family protein [Fusobacterium necrophorum]|nr:Transposase IS116/IS110/IS902 family protein [Fusobacterium necrophorum]SQD09894.1 Transposase IS116/IS110/IS902 family [Fusobacterium necrophorum subsp. necrophorum]